VSGATALERPLRRRHTVPLPLARRVACHRLLPPSLLRPLRRAVARGGRRARRPSRRRPSTAAPQIGDRDDAHAAHRRRRRGVAAAAESTLTATAAEVGGTWRPLPLLPSWPRRCRATTSTLGDDGEGASVGASPPRVAVAAAPLPHRAVTAAPLRRRAVAAHRYRRRRAGARAGRHQRATAPTRGARRYR